MESSRTKQRKNWWALEGKCEDMSDIKCKCTEFERMIIYVIIYVNIMRVWGLKVWKK